MIRRGIVMSVFLVAAIAIFTYYVTRDPMNLTYSVNVATNEEASEIKLINKFDLPDQLKEVSGIVYLEKDHFLCIQDENGIIYTYKTDNEKIIKEVNFSGDGDYEDLVKVNNNVYVIKSNGTLYITKNAFDNPQTEVIKLPLTGKLDFEGLAYDQKNNRLLIAQKNSSKEWNNVKHIYAFNLNNKTLAEKTVYKINLTDDIFDEVKDKEKFSPSALAVHPVTGDIYVLEGKHPKLLVMNNSGKLKALYQLSDSNFPQPEGIAFSPEGKLFISNEGQEYSSGNILELEIINNTKK